MYKAPGSISSKKEKEQKPTLSTETEFQDSQDYIEKPCFQKEKKNKKKKEWKKVLGFYTLQKMIYW